MNVVLFVTVITSGRRGAKLEATLMAILALDLWIGVCVLQRKVGLVVIKGLLVQRRDVHIASRMFRMTDTALFLFNASVKSTATGNILGHIGMVMTIQTNVGLRRLVEGQVAVTTVVFKFCMRPTQLAWHHDLAQHTQIRRYGAGPAQEHQRPKKN